MANWNTAGWGPGIGSQADYVDEEEDEEEEFEQKIKIKVKRN